MSEANFRTPFERKRVQVKFLKPSMTKQCFKDECDINTILKKHQKTGVIEHLNRYHGDYSDVCSVEDYQMSLNQVIEAGELFASLPSKVRARFANDPATFLQFVGDPSNMQELIEMGLATPKVPEQGEGPISNVNATADSREAFSKVSRKSKTIVAPADSVELS